MSNQQLEQQMTSGVYLKRDLMLVQGKDALVWDNNGNEFIDCVGGQGTNECRVQLSWRRGRSVLHHENLYEDPSEYLIDPLCGLLP